MVHFGIISPPVSGHLNPLAALGRELQRRGHRVTVFQMPDLEPKIRQSGLEFWEIGSSDHPLGSLPRSIETLGQLSALAALRFALSQIQKTTVMFARDLPPALHQAQVEALIVDQSEPIGAAIAEYLDLPFVTICCALLLNREPSVPPIFTGWEYGESYWRQWRNRLGYVLFDRLTRDVGELVQHYRQQWNLPRQQQIGDSFSTLAQISQQPREFDFPRSCLPPTFHYVGPLRDRPPQTVPFPYERLTGQPLVYASLGTQQNTKVELFRQIAAACADLEVQLVLSHGGGMSEEMAATMPGNPLVVPYAPQYELLARADLTITHAGLNTVLDSLSHGVPLVAIPITYEQPAIAARICWTGVGQVLPLARVNITRLRRPIEQILSQPNYRQQAARISTGITRAGGVKRAATIVEHSVS